VPQKYKFAKSDTVLCISRNLCDHIILHGLTFKELNYRPIYHIFSKLIHTFLQFQRAKNQMHIRIACRLDLRSWAGFWKNDIATVRAIRKIQYNNLLFIILYNILHNIYNLLFIRLTVITHNGIVNRHPVTIISHGVFVWLAVKWPLHTQRASRITVKALVTSNIIQSVCLVGTGLWRKVQIRFGCGLRFENIRYIPDLLPTL